MKLIDSTVSDISTRTSKLSTARVIQDSGRDMLAILLAVMLDVVTWAVL
jgi:hypothetical protein